jgi:hypothetical protein
MFKVSVLCPCIEVRPNIDILAFFDTFNTVFPLFNRESFDRLYYLQYFGQPPTGPAWYASLNVVICLGSMMSKRPLQNDAINFAEEDHWKYFHNACRCFIELLFNDYSLLAVQAMCGMVGGFVCHLSVVVTSLPGFRPTNELGTAVCLRSNCRSRSPSV